MERVLGLFGVYGGQLGCSGSLRLFWLLAGSSFPLAAMRGYADIVGAIGGRLLTGSCQSVAPPLYRGKQLTSTQSCGTHFWVKPDFGNKQ